jgi:hypothetical protein
MPVVPAAVIGTCAIAAPAAHSRLKPTIETLARKEVWVKGAEECANRRVVEIMG